MTSKDAANHSVRDTPDIDTGCLHAPTRAGRGVEIAARHRPEIGVIENVDPGAPSSSALPPSDRSDLTYPAARHSLIK